MSHLKRKPVETPGAQIPFDYGFLAQNLPLGVLTSSGTNTLSVNGTVYVMKLRTDRPITVTNLHIFITTGGGTLTAGQNFGALYSSSKALLSATSDQSTAWLGTGMMTMALTAAQAIPVGNFYVALWSNGTTRPTLRSGNNNTSSINGLLSAANALWATADTGVTTTPPATLAAFTADTNGRWVGVS